MSLRTVIILRTPGGDIEVYRFLRGLCRAMGWSYNTLSRKGDRFGWRGYIIEKKEIL